MVFCLKLFLLNFALLFKVLLVVAKPIIAFGLLKSCVGNDPYVDQKVQGNKSIRNIADVVLGLHVGDERRKAHHRVQDEHQDDLVEIFGPCLGVALERSSSDYDNLGDDLRCHQEDLDDQVFSCEAH